MKKGKIFFHPIGGVGSLTISWTSGPKGDAVEAKKGSGVGFFSEEGNLLCVIFDEVESAEDHQTLEFDRDRIEVTIKKSRVTYTVSRLKKVPLKRIKHTKRRQSV